MGVTGLWTVVQPCARPIKVETLNKKRLAVDASIWIYQFLKAVRDKEGNALRNSHVVGFFRRICKLLFFGIKPVFVFDGGAPALKRQTITGRKQRREGRREDAVRTAGKLLALQMQRRAEEEERRRREAEHGRPQEQEEELPENLVYVDELNMTQQERQQARKFRKKDAYHLPELDVSLSEMGGPNDPRIMSLEELEAYARQFDTGEDINVYDFSKIDFDSPFFISLPDSDRYNILNAARLRSRLRMGYSKEQLDSMFPDRMAFSRFQIERVRERNELTQRLMNINGMTGDGALGLDNGGRIAGEKGREYVLVKNDGVEGGWALGVVSKEGERNKPIDVDGAAKSAGINDDRDTQDDDDESFEDIPVEGLNRLPSQRKTQFAASSGDSKYIKKLVEQRKTLYESRKKHASGIVEDLDQADEDDPDSLFLRTGGNGQASVRKDSDGNSEIDQLPDDEDSEIQRAIALSLQQEDHDTDTDEDDDFIDDFNQAKVEAQKPFFKGSGQAIARMANLRSNKAAKQIAPLSDSEDDSVDLQAALAESRRSKRRPSTEARQLPKTGQPTKAASPAPPISSPAKTSFGGPLPFEKLDLGSSLLGKKKMAKLEQDNAGGFEKETKKKPGDEAAPLPPWFSADLEKEISAQKMIEDEDRQKDKKFSEEQFQFEKPSVLRKVTPEIIDVDRPADKGLPEIVDVVSSGDSESHTPLIDEDETEGMDGVVFVPQSNHLDNETDIGPAERRVPSVEPEEHHAGSEELRHSQQPQVSDADILQGQGVDSPANEVDNDRAPAEPEQADITVPSSQLPRSPSLEFEDVLPVDPPIPVRQSGPTQEDIRIEEEQLEDGIGSYHQDEIEVDEDVYSDSEDEELLQQLAIEEQEHARFAATLNNKAPELTAAEYERELKALRNQQKKDRRDADEVTQTMITECQQLLTLFGLPYITAPMEAEAQCAELVALGLVDGIVTDDSDIFLFGGTRIYKNMFNQAKFVECYLLQDVMSDLGLDRQKMISIAHLLGSDYTEGLPGIGPVTALEILSEFGSLHAFKEWYSAVQSGTRPKEEDAKAPFRRKFRRNATKLFLPPGFPDPRVDEAYLHPEVDSDPQPFVWGVPDLAALRSFLSTTIGWSESRTDEILVPVIKDMNRRDAEGTQSNITKFFGGAVGAGAFAPRRREEGKSKRMEAALSRMAERSRRETIEEVEQDADQNTDEGMGRTGGVKEAPVGTNDRPPLKKRRKKGPQPSTPSSGAPSDSEDYNGAHQKKRKNRKQIGRRKVTAAS